MFMAESIAFSKTEDRAAVYAELAPQIEALIAGETDLIANLANIAAVLKEAFGFFWVGFYIVRDDQLVLGPFQGPLACTRIGLGQGVCGHCWERGETVIVPDVEKFPGHIACSSLSRSEIVLPVKGRSDEVIAVLDVDSDRPDDFSREDADGLGAIVKLIEKTL
jgi:GAF domain-containing protein